MRASAWLGLLVLLLAAGAGATGMDPGFTPRPGAQLPMDAPLRDESAHIGTLRERFAGEPWILALGYFNCPNLCDTIRADLAGALGGMPADLRYRVAALSIDAKESSTEARDAHARDAAAHGARISGWQYLVAEAGSLAPILQAVGFVDRRDAASGQIAHPAGLVFVTPDGRIAGYLLGVGYRSGEVERALRTAADGGVSAAPPAALALLCFDFDSSTGRYTLAIVKLLRLLSVAAVLGFGAGILILYRRPRVAK